MKYPNLTALFEITLTNDLLWVEKNGISHKNSLTQKIKFTTTQNLQEKINKFLDNSDLLLVKQVYDETEEVPLSKKDFYDFVENINENKDINLIDFNDFSIKLTFVN